MDEQEPILQQDTQEEAPEGRSRGRGLLWRLAVVLIALIVCLVVVQGVYYRLGRVYVFGNKTISSQDVVMASGLVEGLNMLTINEEEIARNMSANHWLKLVRLEKDFPSTINLYIEEREPVAVIQWLGVQYTLDDAGMVMTEKNVRELPQDKIFTTGLLIMNIHVGLTVETSDQRQLAAYRSILYELRQQYYVEEIAEINLKDVNSIYLVTRDGIIVRMGDYHNAKAKICAVRTDVAYLRELGNTAGLLDVSIPEDAKYTPDSGI